MNLHALDPRARAGAVVASWPVVAACAPWPEAVAAQAAVAVLVARAVGVPWAGMARRLRVLLGFALWAAACALLRPTPHAPRALCFLVCGGLYAVASASALAGSAGPSDLLQLLRDLRLPPHVAWTLVLGVRYLPLLRTEGARVVRAATARWWRRNDLRALGWMSARMLTRSFLRALRVARSMEARGFGARVTPRTRPLRAGDWVAMAGYPLLVAVVGVGVHLAW